MDKQDIPDLIAGALGVSRGTAYDLMREALAEQPAQQQEPKPKFVRNVDGVPCITLVEHEYLMRSRTSPQPRLRVLVLCAIDK